MSIYNDASLIFYPSGYKEDKLYNLKPIPYLGSELVTNGDFSSGSTGWTLESGWSISGGLATHSGTTSNLISSATLVNGKTYVFEFLINSIADGVCNLYDTGSATTYSSYNSVGLKTFTFVKNSSSSIALRSNSTSCSITSISVKEVIDDADLTFTRASTATRVNAEGLIETPSVLGSELIPTQATIVNLGGGTITQILGNSYSSTSNGASGSTLRPKFDVAVTNGKKYKLIITPIGSISGVINFDLYDGASYVFNDYNFATVKEVIFTANASSIFLAFDGTKIYSVSNFTISLKEVIENNVPRIDYTGGGCGKLLLEPQRTNLALYSSEFDNAYWAKSASTISANVTTSPDGTTNADKLIDNSTLAGHSFNSTTSMVSGTTYTWSIFAKMSEIRYLTLRYVSGGAFSTNYITNFDLLNGTATNSATLPASSFLITSFGNGWYKCSISQAANATGTGTYAAYLSKDGVASTYTGNGTDGLFIYGAQLELGSYSTSLINTTSTAVTRTQDSASKSGISSLIGQTEGVLFVEAIFSSGYDANNLLMTVSDNTASNFIYINRSGGKLELAIKAAAVAQMTYISPTVIGAGVHKIALAYKANDFVVYIDGVLTHTDTSGSVPACSKLNVGSYYNEAFPYNNGVSQAILFPTRLTNDQLADLTGGNKTTFNALAEFYGYQML